MKICEYNKGGLSNPVSKLKLSLIELDFQVCMDLPVAVLFLHAKDFGWVGCWILAPHPWESPEFPQNGCARAHARTCTPECWIPPESGRSHTVAENPAEQPESGMMECENPITITCVRAH
jgi:hypothetical protein